MTTKTKYYELLAFMAAYDEGKIGIKIEEVKNNILNANINGEISKEQYENLDKRLSSWI